VDELTKIALDAAAAAGADFADARACDERTEHVGMRTGEINIEQNSSLGVGIRAVVGTGQGFAASADTSKAALEAAARSAVAQAKAADDGPGGVAVLSPEPAHRDAWATPMVVDPFTVPLDEKVGLLVDVNAKLRTDDRIRATGGTIVSRRRLQLYASTEGARIEQLLVRTGGGFEATAVADGEVQRRSYPAPFGGQHMTAGYEVILGLRLLDHADRVREEAIELLTAPLCPEQTTTLILGTHQMALQIHESAGHALEFDRVIGHEEDFAGRSFLTHDKRGDFRYGSELVTLVADQTVPGGLSTAGYDDEGVAAQRFEPIKEGRLQHFLTDRRVAAICGDERSRGCGRAESWSHIPMLRIPNLSIAPGTWDVDALIADTDEGVFMDTNKTWSIDQLRLNFQFACEVGWEIKGGKRGRLLRNPTYQGITPEFWGSCDAVCGPAHWELWGLPNCGKGQPMQRGEVSHGASPARFRNVTVGVR
jgi:TldD protein